MKYSIKFTFILLFTLFVSLTAEAQNADWIRVQSDNGEFSIEVPAEYGFFADKDGFLVSDSLTSYPLTEMNMFNAYFEKTLISFESYRGDKSALNALRQSNGENGETSEIKTDGYTIKQVVLKSDKSYSVIKYLYSKNFIYVLTAASRTDETPVMKRFFGSLVFKPNEKIPETTPKALTFSQLKATPIEFESEVPKAPPANILPNTPTLPKSDEMLPMVLITKPRASFTNAARRNNETGKILLRVMFSQAGRITKISLIERGKVTVLRQAVFAAIRIKFIPQEKNNEPLTVTKLIEYSFNIY